MASAPPLNHTQFAVDVLHGIGIPNPTHTQVYILLGWMALEGGHTNGALYNPLNTTQPEPGAGNTGTQGNIKVYRNYQQGVTATVATLKNGHYGPIIAALKAGDPSAAAAAIDQSPWGTHGDLLGSMYRFIKAGGGKLPHFSGAGGFQGFAASDTGGVVAGALGVAASPVTAVKDVAGFVGQLSTYIFDPAWWGRIGLYAGGILLIGLGLVLAARDFR